MAARGPDCPSTGLVMRPAVAAVLFACLLLTLAATSSPRVVGDGSEYVHMAARLASGHLPGAGESRHFIFYSALAAPVVALVTREMSRSFTMESGPVEETRIRIRPGLARQATRLPSPQPWVMLVAEAR